MSVMGVAEGVWRPQVHADQAVEVLDAGPGQRTRRILPGRKDEQLVRDFVTTAKHGMRPA